jgi:hypothetical protein
MSAPFIIPFNFQPVSVSVKTGSYTIPAGNYARVLVECDSGGTFTIDTVTAVTTAAFVNIDLAAGSADLNHTVPTGFRSIVSVATTGADTITVNGNLLLSSTTPGFYNSQLPNIEIGPGGNVLITNSIGGSKSIVGVSIPSNATHRQAEFWLPSGTVINGTGTWRAVVMEYNEIT